jgi:hypothetical protein
MKGAYVVAVMLVAAAPAVAQESKAWKLYDEGVRWEASLAAAKERAAKEGKPVLFHQLVGDMDKEGC